MAGADVSARRRRDGARGLRSDGGADHVGSLDQQPILRVSDVVRSLRRGLSRVRIRAFRQGDGVFAVAMLTRGSDLAARDEDVVEMLTFSLSRDPAHLQ